MREQRKNKDIGKEFSFSGARSKSNDGRRYFRVAVPSKWLRLSSKEQGQKGLVEISELKDNAPIATGTSKKFNTFLDSEILLGGISVTYQKDINCLKGILFSAEAA